MFVIVPIVEYDIVDPYALKLAILINLVKFILINNDFFAMVLAITFLIMRREECGVAK